MRPPSRKLNNLRPTAAPKGSYEAVPGLNDARSFAEAFIACLTALVSEVRSKPGFKQRLKLLNGERQDIHNNVYSFVLNDDDAIFEGSRVQVFINKDKYLGSILNVSNLKPKIVLLELDKNVGNEIKICEIEQDDATFYEALLERYQIEADLKPERSKQKVNSDFLFADRVIENDPQKVEHTISVSTAELNSDQCAFIEKALNHDVSFLWGPPGTGKTKCLGSLISSLYDVEERSLVASNTNQAVDQVLLKLCRELKLSGRLEELKKGRIIRLGAIQNFELKIEFEEFINIEAITERLGKPLQAVKEKLSNELANLNLELGAFSEQKQNIEKREYWGREVQNLEKVLDTSKNSHTRTTERTTEKTVQKSLLRDEIQAVGSRGIFKAIFGKTRQQLSSEISKVDAEISELQAKLAVYQKNLEAAQTKLSTAKDNFNKMVEFTGNISLEQLQKRKVQSENRSQAIRSELRELRKKLEELSGAILRDARVIGSTLSKVFLVPAQIGKYQNLIIDEASMATLPTVHFAASLATKRVIVSGDFRQLPPIVETNNKHIEHVIGSNVFLYSKGKNNPIAQLFDGSSDAANAHMLEWQYRMPETICQIISDFSYNSKLKTAPAIKYLETLAPQGLEEALIVVDTSDVKPFCDVNGSGSRNNMVHALISERIAKLFADLKEYGTVGICSPFRSQSNLVKRILKQSGLEHNVAVGTIHTFQGDEKDTIIFDTVDGLGAAKTAGSQISKDNPAEAQLLNVALSRAKQRVIIIANLNLLDTTLPGLAFLRTILSTAKSKGSVLPSSRFLPLQKIEVLSRSSFVANQEKVTQLLAELGAREVEINNTQKELDALKRRSQKEINTKLINIKVKEGKLNSRDQAMLEAQEKIKNEREEIRQSEVDLLNKINKLVSENIKLKKNISELAVTLVSGDEFMEILTKDLSSAKRSVIIYSGFASANRVIKLIGLLKLTMQRGVKVRVIVRRPDQKDQWAYREGVSAVGMLRKIGVAVDLRAEIHQKAVLIDNEVTWFGSLNPLSFNEQRSDETMARIEGILKPLDFARLVAIRGEYSVRSLSDLVQLENPRCKYCNSHTEYTRFRGKRFVCVDCGKITPFAKRSKK